MKTSTFTTVILVTSLVGFSSCQKMSFGQRGSDDSASLSIEEEELPCMNKDMASHLYAVNEVEENEDTLVRLHLYSCDERSLKEVQWFFPEGSLIKYTGEDNEILISFEEAGEKTISVAIVFKDTILDEEGNHTGGPAPRILTKKITVTPKADNCANKDKDSHLVSDDQVDLETALKVSLHLYSCDAVGLKEVRWSASGGELKLTEEQNEVNVTFDTAGEYEVQATIVYKDTVFDGEGKYLSGTRPKVVSKIVTVLKYGETRR